MEENRKANTLNQKKLQEAEKLLRLAFVEFYRGLSLLKSYRFESRINLFPSSQYPESYFFCRFVNERFFPLQICVEEHE